MRAKWWTRAILGGVALSIALTTGCGYYGWGYRYGSYPGYNYGIGPNVGPYWGGWYRGPYYRGTYGRPGYIGPRYGGGPLYHGYSGGIHYGYHR